MTGSKVNVDQCEFFGLIADLPAKMPYQVLGDVVELLAFIHVPGLFMATVLDQATLIKNCHILFGIGIPAFDKSDPVV